MRATQKPQTQQVARNISHSSSHEQKRKKKNKQRSETVKTWEEEGLGNKTVAHFTRVNGLVIDLTDWLHLRCGPHKLFLFVSRRRQKKTGGAGGERQHRGPGEATKESGVGKRSGIARHRNAIINTADMPRATTPKSTGPHGARYEQQTASLFPLVQL